MTPSPQPRILIADDQPAVREALRLLFTNEGYQTELYHSPEAALDALRKRDFAVVFMDLNYTRDTTSGQEGLNILADIAALESPPPVVVMTAWATVDLAVETLRKGARDFIQKPWDNPRVLSIARTQIELAAAERRSVRLEAENRVLREESCSRSRAAEGLVTRAPAMKPVLELIRRVGPSDANVLVTGENGTGKTLIASALHAASPRASKPLITVNLSGLSEGVFESEIFGHVRGAFTDSKADRVGRFELADGGALFLDEIAMSPSPSRPKCCACWRRAISTRRQLAYAPRRRADHLRHQRRPRCRSGCRTLPAGPALPPQSH